MVSIVDLIKKYTDVDSLDYVFSIIGDEQHVNYIFNDMNNTRNLLADLSSDLKLLEIFHSVYINIKDDNIYKNSQLFNCLLMFDIAYQNLKKQLNDISVKRIKSIVLLHDIVLKQNQERINNMKTANNIEDNYPYKNLVIELSNKKDEFSLNEEYSVEAFNYTQGLNGVSIITPSQTCSYFNDETINGLKGSGHHDARFLQIIEAIYGRVFNNAVTGQDIKIRHVAYMKNKSELEFLMTLEIPLLVNSSQKQALSYLNDEIKKHTIESNNNFVIHAMITDYMNMDYCKNINAKANLDDILEQLIVDDNIEYKYQEKCFIGYSNFENHYNISKQK